MTYTKTTWAGTSKITATAFNHFETQYSQMYTDYLYGHNHDSRYYPKSTAESTFYWIGNMGSDSGADGDLLDGHHASEVVGKTLEVGTIVMWKQSDGDIPTGWHLCDGTTVGSETTVDLRDLFVCCAGDTYSVGDNFGSATVTPTAATVTVDGHTITEAEMAAHTHGYTDIWEYGQDSSWQGGGSGYGNNHMVTNDTTTKSTSTDGGSASPSAHTHTSGSSGTYSSEANIPPYYALYFIQRVS